MRSSLKAGSFKTQEELMFQFESEDRKRLLSQLKAVRQEELPLTRGSVSPFVLLGPSADWVRPTHTGEGNLLFSVCRFTRSSHPKVSWAHPK